MAIYQYRTIADLDGVRDCKKTLGLLLPIWLENAVSLLYAGQNPTSSKDPFGISRRLKYVFEIADQDLGLANFKAELAGVLEGYFWQTLVHKDLIGPTGMDHPTLIKIKNDINGNIDNTNVTELLKLQAGIGIKELAEKITEVALKHQKD